MGIFTGRRASPVLRIALAVVLLPLGTVSAHHRAALSRREVFLDGRDNHQQFRGFLETWVLEIARREP
jgi:hypothetical protein